MCILNCFNQNSNDKSTEIKMSNADDANDYTAIPENYDDLKEQYRKLFKNYKALLEYRQTKEQRRKDKISSTLTTFEKKGLTTAKITKYKDIQFQIPNGMYILDNKGKKADHHRREHGVLFDAFGKSKVKKNLDNLDKILYSTTPECFYKDIDGIYKKFDKEKDINNEKIKAKNLIMAWQLKTSCDEHYLQ